MRYPQRRGDGRRPGGLPPRRAGLGPLDQPPRPGQRGSWARPITPPSSRTGASSGSTTASRLLVFFGVTNALSAGRGGRRAGPTCCSSPSGLGAWAALFWALRRQGGPITFVERQLAHVWGSGIVAINLVFLVEWLLGLPVLSLVTDDRRDQRHALHGQGGHPLGLLLLPGGGRVPGDLADGVVPAASPR